MTELIFYALATLILVSGLFCVISKHPMNAAVSLIVLFLSLSGIFILLEAYLLALMQALIYGGGIIVLFIFVIMLIKPTQLSSYLTKWTLFTSIIGLLSLIASSIYLFGLNYNESFPSYDRETISVSFPSNAIDVSSIIFSKYMLLFQISGLLILGTIVGVITLCHLVPVEKRRLFF